MVAMVAIFLMMLLITLGAAVRYFSDKSIPGLYEMTKNYLMVIVSFMGISFTHYRKDHIRFVLIYQYISPKVQRWINFVNDILVLAFFALLFMQGLHLTRDAWVNDSTTGGIVSLPMYLSYIWMPIGMIAVCLLVLTEILAFLFQKGKGQAPASAQDQA
jgi:TRAP-type C4-dicarboxylate transport system permease small subunit